MTWWKWNRETDETFEGDSPLSDEEFIEEGRRVEATHLAEGKLWLSTVFLGLDHNWFRVGGPILFESMLFDQTSCRSSFWGRYPMGHDLFMDRYHTAKEARAGHEKIVRVLEFCLKTPRASHRNIAEVLRKI